MHSIVSTRRMLSFAVLTCVFISSTSQARADGGIESATSPGQAQPQPHVFNEKRGSCFGFIADTNPNAMKIDAETKGFFKNYKGLQASDDDLRVWFDKNKRRFSIGANKELSFDDLLKGRTNDERSLWFRAEAQLCEEENNLVLSARLHQESLRLLESENQPERRRIQICEYINVIKKLGYDSEAKNLEHIFDFDHPNRSNIIPVHQPFIEGGSRGGFRMPYRSIGGGRTFHSRPVEPGVERLDMPERPPVPTIYQPIISPSLR